MTFIFRELADGWCAEELDGGAAAIAAVQPGGGAALLLRSRGPAGEEWFVLAVTPGGVELNGAPLYAGMRALHDRDLVAVDGVGRVFFTTQRLARVAPFAGAAAPMYCPRDRRILLAGEPVVQCPAAACAAFHHAECWSYSATCSLCDQPTALDSGLRWSPDELGPAAGD